MYPQLFEYADVICHVIYLPKYLNMEKNESDIFYVVDNVQSSSLISYFEQNIDLLRQRTRNNFIQELMARDNDTIRAIPRYRS